MTVPYGLLETPTNDPRRRLSLPRGVRSSLPSRNASVPFGSRGSLWQRIQRRLMPVPDSLQGLLSDQDVSQARERGMLSGALSLLDSTGPTVGPRSSLGQDVGRAIGAGTGTFDETLGQSLQMRQFAESQEREQLLRQRRAAILQKHPVTPTMSDDQRAAAFERMLPEFIAINDIDTAKAIIEFLKSRADKKGPTLNTLDTGAEKVDRLVYPDGSIREVGRTTKTPGPLDPNAARGEAFTFEQQLGDDYRQETRDFALVGNSIGVIRAATPSALAGDVQAQMALIFGFMKLLDPGSSVREGEYASAENARGVAEAIRNTYNKILDGSRLGRPQVERFAKQAETQAAGWMRRLNVIKKRYDARARRWGVDPELIVFDPFEGSAPEEAPPSGAAGSTGDANNVRQFLKKPR